MKINEQISKHYCFQETEDYLIYDVLKKNKILSCKILKAFLVSIKLGANDMLL